MQSYCSLNMQNCDVLVAVAVVVVEAPYVSDPESVTSLDNSFLPSSLQQPQHKKKLARRKNLLFTSAVFYFRAFFTSCVKQSRMWKTESQTQLKKVTVFAIKPSQTTFECLRRFCVYMKTRLYRTKIARSCPLQL